MPPLAAADRAQLAGLDILRNRAGAFKAEQFGGALEWNGEWFDHEYTPTACARICSAKKRLYAGGMACDSSSPVIQSMPIAGPQ